MVAKLASDAAKPRGLMEVREGWEEGFVAGLPLRALPGVGPRTAERLESLGLTEVWQVQARSVEELERLIGAEAKRLKRRAHGHGGRVLRARQETKSVSRETTLGGGLRRPGPARADPPAASRRTWRASSAAKELAARTVTLKLRHGDFVTITRSQTLPAPTDLDADLVGAARALLRTAFEEVRRRGRGVRLIGVAAHQPGRGTDRRPLRAPGADPAPAADLGGGPGRGSGSGSTRQSREVWSRGGEAGTRGRRTHRLM